MLQDVLKKKCLKLRQLRVFTLNLIDNYRVSARRACMVMMIGRAALRYQSTRRDEEPLRERIKEIAVSRVRYGSERIYMLLRREGWPDNHKRVRRIYREEGLNLRNKRPHRSKAAAHRLDRPELSNLDQCWSMDFVHDQLDNNKKNFDELITSLINIGENASEGQKIELFKTAILKTNKLNAEIEGLIETGERKDLFELADKITIAYRLDPHKYRDGEGLASEWREW